MMLSTTRHTLAVAIATAFRASPALATASTATSAARTPHRSRRRSRRGDHRSENARSRSAEASRRTARRLEVTKPAGGGFDWTAAIIGMGAGLALAVLAGVGVAGGRRWPSTA